MKKPFLLIVFTLCAVISSPSQDCSQILKQGIYDIYSNVSDTERADSFVNWFKQRDFHSYDEAKKYGANVAIPIDGVLIPLGFTADEKGFEQFQRDLENYVRQTSEFRQQIKTFVKTINKDVVAAWSNCMSNQTVHVWLELSADPTAFVISGRYISDGGPNPKLTTMEFTPPDAIEFRSGTFVDGKGRLRNAKLTGSRSSQTFRRSSSKNISLLADPVTINVTLDRGPGMTFSLPALRKPKPVISDFSASETNINLGASSTLRWEVFNAKAIELEGVSYPNSSGTLEVKPTRTKKFTLHARNDGGETMQETIVKVVVPKLISGSVIFATGGDDKDKNTKLSVRVFNSKGAVIAIGAALYDDVNFKEHTDKNSVLLSVTQEAYKEDLAHGKIEIAIRPKGKDHWDYKPKLDLTFSDGSNLRTDWLGNETGIEADDTWSSQQNWNF